MTDVKPIEKPKFEIVLEAGRAESNYWADLWTYRELFVVLAWRDVSVRYKQSVIGASWAVIKPLLTMVIFTFIFGRVAGLESDGQAPYAIMVFAGMLPWFLFSSILSEASNSLVTNSNMIRKIYFPRIMIPASTSVVSLVDFSVSLAMMVVLMLIFSYYPNHKVVFLPLFIIWAIMAAMGPALLLAALNVRYRDFRFIVPFIVQFGLYVTPVGFSSSVVPDEYRLLYSANPVVSVIDGFRWCLLGNDAALYMPGVYIGLITNVFFLWLGIKVFRNTEKTFADLI
ncbi:MAG: ABC transporter permease [Pseudomonadota bacterium]